MNVKSSCKILIVDPSVVAVKGLTAVLSEYDDLKVAGYCHDMVSCSEKLLILQPDIVVLNPCLIDHHRKNNFKSLFAGSNSSPAVVALVYNYFSDELLRQFDEILSFYDEPHQIVRKLRNVNINDNSSSDASLSGEELSDREKEILVAVAKGMTNKEIADAHNISIHTVISHRKNITRKTGIKTVSGLTVYALLNSFLDMSEVE